MKTATLWEESVDLEVNAEKSNYKYVHVSSR
jgi:hypothetical protein